MNCDDINRHIRIDNVNRHILKTGILQKQEIQTLIISNKIRAPLLEGSGAYQGPIPGTRKPSLVGGAEKRRGPPL